MLLQNPDDLLIREAAAFHVLVLSLGQNELQTGLSQRGQRRGHCGRHVSLVDEGEDGRVGSMQGRANRAPRGRACGYAGYFAEYGGHLREEDRGADKGAQPEERQQASEALRALIEQIAFCGGLLGAYFLAHMQKPAKSLT
ncbi:hypothetical protein [Pseudaminobacter salicylatoxidans]|uniref:hypothetical protein n=1 Tax=Pseudaminobacter salicylatoxidans TaxID=93369 RepID=UPI0018E09239|nr:hypothetical protein [Pseudaminobacter salicylatoxidans]